MPVTLAIAAPAGLPAARNLLPFPLRRPGGPGGKRSGCISRQTTRVRMRALGLYISRSVEAYRAMASNATLVTATTLPDVPTLAIAGGHIIPLEQPDALAACIARYLAANMPAAS